MPVPSRYAITYNSGMRCSKRAATRLAVGHAKSDRIPDSPFSNYSDIDAVANSGNHTTSLYLHPLHTYHTLIPTPFLLDFLTIPILTESLIVQTTALDLLATLSTLTTL
ncbi:hypothetical protein [Moorena sp. SIO3B2]|uniref:hypothetical protein n=1 Tax=Moorena sp. SIO3B2 TaxID=2607827 RepID=UPI0013CBE7BF|nr:hypothetical protein [Moorena sp. SIO3B2]NEP35915.1 hypothetical protein [Moorena sp. SIO3B2]